MKMSGKYGIHNRDRSGQEEVDFDFFESPRNGRPPKKSGKDNSMNDKQSPSGKGGKPSHWDSSNGTTGKEVTTKVPTAKQDEYSDSYDSESDSGNEENTSGRKSRAAHMNRRDSSGSSSRTRSSQSSSDNSRSRSRSRSRSYSPDEKRMRPKSGRPKSGRPEERHHSKNDSDSSCSDSDSDSSCSSDSQDSDMTDVSPLASPRGKKKNKHVTLSDMPTMIGKPPAMKSRPKSGKKAQRGNLLDPDSDSMNLKLLMEAVLEMEHKDDGRQPSRMSRPRSGKQFSIPKGPTSQNKKNMSFQNDKTRDIDRENQRLMQEILKYASMTKKKQKKKSQPKTSPAAKVTSSAVNRDREQRRIDQENWAMLQRLKSVKASTHLRRDDLMDTYSNQLLFGVPMSAVHPVEKKKNGKGPSPYEASLQSRSGSSLRGTSASSSGRQRPFSAQVRQTRPVSGKARPQSAKVGGTFSQPEWESGW